MLTAIGRAAAFRLPIRTAQLIVSRPQPFVRAACRSFSTTQWSRLAAKAAAAKKPTKKTTPVESKAKKAASPKTKKAAPAEPKNARVKKPLTPEQVQKIKVKTWKEQSLVASEPKSKARNVWTVYMDEYLQKHAGSKAGDVAAEASAKFKELSPEEVQRLGNIAAENMRTWQAEWKAWLTSHTPQQIVTANTARGHLRKVRGKQTPRHLRDERIPKLPLNAYPAYVRERMTDGSMTGMAAGHLKTIAEEWKALSEDEKAPYHEKAEVERERYRRDVFEVLGRPIRS